MDSLNFYKKYYVDHTLIKLFKALIQIIQLFVVVFLNPLKAKTTHFYFITFKQNIFLSICFGRVPTKYLNI